MVRGASWAAGVLTAPGDPNVLPGLSPLLSTCVYVELALAFFTWACSPTPTPQVSGGGTGTRNTSLGWLMRSGYRHPGLILGLPRNGCTSGFITFWFAAGRSSSESQLLPWSCLPRPLLGAAMRVQGKAGYGCRVERVQPHLYYA